MIRPPKKDRKQDIQSLPDNNVYKLFTPGKRPALFKQVKVTNHSFVRDNNKAVTRMGATVAGAGTKQGEAILCVKSAQELCRTLRRHFFLCTWHTATCAPYWKGLLLTVNLLINAGPRLIKSASTHFKFNLNLKNGSEITKWD